MVGMVVRLALVLSICAAFVQAPIGAPAAQCCLPDLTQKMALVDGCCAGTACCVISGDPAEQPLTASPATNDVSAFSAPICVVSLIDFQAGQQETHFAKAQPVAHSPPPLALLCTFLI